MKLAEGTPWSLLTGVVMCAFMAFGALQTYIIPPFQAPDENWHWQSAIIRVERLFNHTDEVCSKYLALADSFDANRLHFETNQKVIIGALERQKKAQATCVQHDVPYGSMLSYPGASVAYALLRSEDSETQVLKAFYFARILEGSLVGLSLLYMLISLNNSQHKLSRISTIMLGFVIGLTLSPKIIQQSFAVSSDPAVNSFALSLTPLLFNRSISTKGLLWTAFIGACAVSTKPIIIPVIIPIIFWVWVRNPRQSEIKKLFAVGILLTLIGIYFGLSAESVSNLSPYGNPPLQREEIIRHPYNTALILLDGLSPLRDLGWTVDKLAWSDYSSSFSTAITYVLMVISLSVATGSLGYPLSCMSLNRENHNKYRLLNPVSSIVVLLGITFSGLLIVLYLYLTFTPVGYDHVRGVQGRYFYPHVVLLAALYASRFPPMQVKLKNPSWIFQTSIVLTIGMMLFQLSGRAADCWLRYFG